MKSELDRVGAKLRAFLRGRDLRTVPKEIKQKVIAYVEARQAQHVPFMEIARDLNLVERTLRRWCRVETSTDQGFGAMFRSVSLQESALSDVDADERRIVITLPSGVRIEGVDIGRIAFLLRKLS